MCRPTDRATRPDRPDRHDRPDRPTECLPRQFEIYGLPPLPPTSSTRRSAVGNRHPAIVARCLLFEDLRSAILPERIFDEIEQVGALELRVKSDE